MSFGKHAEAGTHEVYVANCRQAYDRLRPELRFVTSRRGGVPCSVNDLDDDEVATFVESDRKVRDAAAAMTKRQVGDGAWREYRDEAKRVQTTDSIDITKSRSIRRQMARGVDRITLP